MTRQTETIVISIVASLCSSLPVSTGHFEQKYLPRFKDGIQCRKMFDVYDLPETVTGEVGRTQKTTLHRLHRNNSRVALPLHQHHWKRPVHVTSVIMSASHILKFAAIY